MVRVERCVLLILLHWTSLIFYNYLIMIDTIGFLCNCCPHVVLLTSSLQYSHPCASFEALYRLEINLIYFLLAQFFPRNAIRQPQGWSQEFLLHCFYLLFSVELSTWYNNLWTEQKWARVHMIHRVKVLGTTNSLALQAFITIYHIIDSCVRVSWTCFLKTWNFDLLLWQLVALFLFSLSFSAAIILSSDSGIIQFIYSVFYLIFYVSNILFTDLSRQTQWVLFGFCVL